MKVLRQVIAGASIVLLAAVALAVEPLGGATVTAGIHTIKVGVRVPGLQEVQLPADIGSLRATVLDGPCRLGTFTQTDATQISVLTTPNIGGDGGRIKIKPTGNGPVALHLQWWNQGGTNTKTLTFTAQTSAPNTPTPNLTPPAGTPQAPPAPDADLLN